MKVKRLEGREDFKAVTARGRVALQDVEIAKAVH